MKNIVENRGNEIWFTSEKDPAEEALYQEVMNVMGKEMFDRGPILWDERHFGAGSLDTHIFDFIEVDAEEGNRRFLMMLYAPQNRNYYNPRYLEFQNVDFYPAGFEEDRIRKAFREDLENGKIPKRAIHQMSVRTGSGGGSFFCQYYPCCVEVKDREDIEDIRVLVNIAVEQGIRGPIIVKRPEDLEEILAKVENDDSLTFKYD